MLFIVITASALTCFEMFNLLQQVGNKAFKTLLGYAFIPEIICSLILPAIAMTTGSLTAVLISILAGTFFTATLTVCKKVIGTRKRVKNPITGKKEWKETSGMPFSQYVRELGLSVFNKLKTFGINVAKPSVV